MRKKVIYVKKFKEINLRSTPEDVENYKKYEIRYRELVKRASEISKKFGLKNYPEAFFREDTLDVMFLLSKKPLEIAYSSYEKTHVFVSINRIKNAGFIHLLMNDKIVSKLANMNENETKKYFYKLWIDSKKLYNDYRENQLFFDTINI